MRKIQADEATIKIRLDQRELTETKDEIKAIYLEMMQMQSALVDRLDQVKVESAEQAQ